ncbi:MAG: bifunctional 4-hydroxy-2-oxoglutarate aldolase/2-dehydro-3-deoxy-phosphogluconate aldolase [bacterium]|nr:bifunctional 4-hydroxy-2-oxoglutarate aldolase/2-dehydro-3-deoxy-phosphogluconate aldolase [bacterium]
MNILHFRKLPIMGILRDIDAGMVGPIVEILHSSGLKTIEVTMNTPGAPALISELIRLSRGEVYVGAGPVLTPDDLSRALDAGASFIVLPGVVHAVVARCVEKGIPVFPGAFTPTEIHHAWSLGATMVKVFPANRFGPSYLQDIRGPFRDIKLLACGGVTPDTVQSYFDFGASAVAVGSGIFQPELLRSRKYSLIGRPLKILINRYHEWQDQQVDLCPPNAMGEF